MLMGWADLLGESETVIAPWLGGRRIVSGVRQWTIDGRLPPEHGWYTFTVTGGRKAKVGEPAMADPELFEKSAQVRGYLIGNRLVADDTDFERDSARIIGKTRVVYLLEPGLERFARVLCAVHDERLVYLQPEFPLGPEPDVIQAFEDRVRTLDSIAEVTPALHMAFRWQSWWRDEQDRQVREEEERIRREEQAQIRAEEAERRRIEEAREAEREAERQRVATQAAERRFQREQRRNRGRNRGHNRGYGGGGSGGSNWGGAQVRRQAQRVLSAAGAELLDWGTARGANQATVRFRFLGHRFRSVVRLPGLQVVEAGICLTDARTGERGDDRFTLASLPGVIQQAHRQGMLVILRW